MRENDDDNKRGHDNEGGGDHEPPGRDDDRPRGPHVPPVPPGRRQVG